MREKQTPEYPLADWYYGALYALGDTANPERLSHAAHSLREMLEKLPKWTGVPMAEVNATVFFSLRGAIKDCIKRAKNHYVKGWSGDITSTLRKAIEKMEEYLALNDGPKRQEQTAKSVLKLNPFHEFADKARKEQIETALTECGVVFQNFAHHNKAADKENDLRQALGIVENLLIRILNPSAIDVQMAVQLVVREDPETIEPERLDKIFDLLRQRDADYNFFFRNLKNPKWIFTLDQHRFFDAPPGIKQVKGGFQFPFWMPFLFLVSVAAEVADKAIEICQKLPPTDNSRIYSEITNVALAIKDVAQSVRLKGKILEGAKLDFHLLSEHYSKILAHWASEPAGIASALELARVIVPFRADLRFDEKAKLYEENPKDYDATLKPEPRFDSWEYHRILSEGLAPLARQVPVEVAVLLIESTADFIAKKYHDPVKSFAEQEGDDYSSIWCKRVDGPVGEYLDSDEALVHAMTRACEEVCLKATPEVAADLDSKLKAQRWKIFDRVRFHLHGKFPALFKDQIREEIISFVDYSEDDYGREFAGMIKDACDFYGQSLLSATELKKITDAIMRGPDQASFKEWMGDKYTDEIFERRKAYFQRQQFWPFQSILSGESAAILAHAISANTDKPGLDTYAPVDMGGGRFMSSKAPEEANDLSTKSDDELIALLNDWDAARRNGEEWWVTIDREGLCGAFVQAMEKAPERFAKWHEQWKKITRPIFLRGAIEFATRQVSAKNFFDLSGWFGLCKIILEKDIRIDVERKTLDEESDTNPDWEQAVRSVERFVGACLQKETQLPIEWNVALGALIAQMCTGKDGVLDRNASVFLEDSDPISTAINTVRGKALESLFERVFWLKRSNAPQAAYTEAIKACTDILELRFAGHPSLTEPERAYLAVQFARMWVANSNWTGSHLGEIFPSTESSREWIITFGSFLRWTHAQNGLWEPLKELYATALTKISLLRAEDEKGSHSRNGMVDSLGQHLFLFYLWGRYPLEGETSFLARFYANTSVKDWGHLLRDAGAMMKDDQLLPEEIASRAMRFCELRLAAAEALPAATPSHEFKSFYGWLRNPSFPAQWRLNMLTRVLDLENAANGSSLFVEELTRLLEGNEAMVVECLWKITKRAKDSLFYVSDKEAKAILRKGLAASDPNVVKRAEEARENLVAAGHSQFLTLDE